MGISLETEGFEVFFYARIGIPKVQMDGVKTEKIFWCEVAKKHRITKERVCPRVVVCTAVVQTGSPVGTGVLGLLRTQRKEKGLSGHARWWELIFLVSTACGWQQTCTAGYWPASPYGLWVGGVSGVATPMAPNAGSTQSYPVFCITPILKDC